MQLKIDCITIMHTMKKALSLSRSPSLALFQYFQIKTNLHGECQSFSHEQNWMNCVVKVMTEIGGNIYIWARFAYRNCKTYDWNVTNALELYHKGRMKSLAAK